MIRMSAHYFNSGLVLECSKISSYHFANAKTFAMDRITLIKRKGIYSRQFVKNQIKIENLRTAYLLVNHLLNSLLLIYRIL